MARIYSDVYLETGLISGNSKFDNKVSLSYNIKNDKGVDFVFYVYEWFIVETNEVFYVGKGKGRRKNDLYKRSRSFLEIYNRFECKNRIVKEFSEEIEAFKFEMERIIELKKIGQATTNNHIGGYGGCTKWTDELREMISKYNPMKSEKQRERMRNDNPMSKPHQRKRMRIDNPMKNKEISKKVGEKHRKPIIINGVEYSGGVEAHKILKVDPTTISSWCKRGYDNNYNPCRYVGEKQKEIPLKEDRYSNNFRGVFVNDVFFKSCKLASIFLNVSPQKLNYALKNNKTINGNTVKYDNQKPSN